MKTYTLKSVLRRGSMFTAALVVAAAAILPAASTYADALNPLTERSLTLSSGSPGWNFTDGSGNATYAPPNSGANGNKTGNTFSFRVSSDATVKAFNFQYCTKSAGPCSGPGDNTGNAGTRAANDATAYAAKTSDLEIKTATPTEISAGNFTALFNATSGQPSSAANLPKADNSQGNFIVLHKATAGAAWEHSAGWAMTSSKVQDGTTDTNKHNYILLANEDGQVLGAGDYVKVIFVGTNTNYITNPGSKEFFVKINSFSSDTAQNDSTRIDGGVTVANVMNRSIEIQTKVLETMDFSVGTVDPNTLATNNASDGSSAYALATGREAHGTCDPVVTGMQRNGTQPNVLQLGDESSEFSLATRNTYSTHSYWRLSSNSSAGATVYYSGVTLSNTVGDQIRAANGGNSIAVSPTPGSEQFGLALDNGRDFAVNSDYSVSYDKERQAGFLFQNGADNAVTGIDTASLTDDNVLSNGSWHAPKLAPLTPATEYREGTGVVNTDWNGGSATVNTKFAFDNNSNLIPTPIASNSNQVVDCVTAKMRYIANIAATTPAGIYTTKINYIAAPQY